MKKVILSICLFFCIIKSVNAEGTYELNNRTNGDNVYVESMPAGSNTGIKELGLERITLFKVDVLNENENIEIYTSAYEGNIDVSIWCEGNVPSSFENDHISAKKVYNIEKYGIGYIESWSELVSVQNIDTRIRKPIIFDTQTEGCGVGTYSIRIYGRGNSQPIDAIKYVDIAVVSNTIDNNCEKCNDNHNYFSFFGYFDGHHHHHHHDHDNDNDCEPIKEIKRGRVWSYHFSLILNGFDKKINAKYFVVAGKSVLDYYEGYLWEVKNNGIQPYGFHVYSNSLGVYPSINNSKSVHYNKNPIMIPEYPIYLNPPEKNVVRPNINPSISNLSFESNCGINENGGVFSFNTNSEWNYSIYVDKNKDEKFMESESILRGKTIAGHNSISWDGKLKDGTYLDSNYEIVINLNVASGEIHFPYYDVENDFGVDGPIIRLYENETEKSKKYYWDDSEIGGDSSEYTGSLLQHKWGGSVSGNEAVVDTWKNAINEDYDLKINYKNDCKESGNIVITIFNDYNHNGKKDENEDYSVVDYDSVSFYNFEKNECNVFYANNNGIIDLLNYNYGNYKIVLSDNNNSCVNNIIEKNNNILTTESEFLFDLNEKNKEFFFGIFKGNIINGLVLEDNGIGEAIANNTVKEFEEKGIENTVLRVFNSLNNQIGYETTDNDGYFKLWIHMEESNIKLVSENPFDYISTNINIGDSGSSVYNNNEINIDLLNKNNINNIVFSKVKKSFFRKNEQKRGKNGAVVLIKNELKNFSDISSSFTLENKNNDWPIVLYKDNNCNDLIDSDDYVINNEIDNESNTLICVLSKIFIPLEKLYEDELIYDLCSYIIHDNSNAEEKLCVTNKVNVSSDNGNIRIIKTSDKNVAKPGEIISYKIELINEGMDAAKDIQVFDFTPPYTKFSSASCGTLNNENNISNCIFITNLNNNKGDIKWDLTGFLNPNEKYEVFYSVIIDN